MISFEPFWAMLKERGITVYDLEYSYNLNPAEISRLKHNHNFTLKFICRLCDLFHCQPNDIISYTSPNIDKKKLSWVLIHIKKQMALPTTCFSSQGSNGCFFKHRPITLN